MDPYQFDATCEVCGGASVSRTSGWLPQQHVDPRVCAQVIYEREEAEKRARLAEQKRAMSGIW